MTPDVRYPTKSVAIDASSTDVDLTLLFTDGYATEIYVGTSAPSDVKVQSLGDSGVIYKNVPKGTSIFGIFTKVFHTGTSASDLVARGKGV
jgi:hypothetical protein